MDDIGGKFFYEAGSQLVQGQALILYFWIYCDQASSFLHFWFSNFLIQGVI